MLENAIKALVKKQSQAAGTGTIHRRQLIQIIYRR